MKGGSQDEGIPADMLPPSDDEDGELTVVNANRRHIATYEEESEEDTSESEEER